MSSPSRSLGTTSARASDRIHILGVGNLGKLIAHSLVKHDPQTAVTLLFHRPSLVSEWDEAGREIECVSDGQVQRSGLGIDTELLGGAGDTAPIKNLIVACKTFMTTSALDQVKERLGHDSTILFLQNGMGTTDEVTLKLFPEGNSRPQYLAGICVAGVYNTKPFSIVHAGKGPLTLGPVPSGETETSEEGAREDSPDSKTNFMIEKLASTTYLQATAVSAAEVRKAQLLKLAANAIINPLTAVLDCKNGELLDNGIRQDLVNRLVTEMGPVIRALLPPEQTEARGDFSDEKLLAYVHMVAEKTGKNTSSMLQDIRAGRRTEIDYINGFIVERGEGFGFACPKHAVLADLVRSAQVIRDEEISGLFP